MKHQISLALVTLLLSFSATAQLRWVDIGVNGLTCSACTRSVEMSIRRLAFVDTVVMSLEETTGRIHLREDQPVNLRQIAKAITNAGFSVRFLSINLDPSEISLSVTGEFTFQGQQFAWVDYPTHPLKKPVSLVLIEEGFLPKKDLLEWRKKHNITQSSQQIWHVVQAG